MVSTQPRLLDPGENKLVLTTLSHIYIYIERERELYTNIYHNQIAKLTTFFFFNKMVLCKNQQAASTVCKRR